MRLNNLNEKTILHQGVEWFSAIATLWLMASLLLTFECQRLSLFIYAIATVADVVMNKRYSGVKWEKRRWVFAAMVAFYACMWIWHIFEACSSAEYFHSTDTRVPLLAFGVLGLCTNLNPKIKVEYITMTMLAASVGTLAYILYDHHEFIANNIKTINEFRDNISILRDRSTKTTHIGSNVYMNCTMAMCFVTAWGERKWWKKGVLYAGVAMMYATISLSEGRAGLITTNLLLITFIGYAIYKHYRKAVVPMVMVCVAVAAIGMSKHSRLQMDVIKNEPRILIWGEAMGLIKERPVLGHGVCDGREKFVTATLNNEVIVKNFWNNWMKKHPDYRVERFHCHNVFIESALEFGVVGLALSIALFVLPIVMVRGRRRVYMAIVMAIFLIQAMFEALTSHFQPMLFCLLIYMLALGEKEEWDEDQMC